MCSPQPGRRAKPCSPLVWETSRFCADRQTAPANIVGQLVGSMLEFGVAKGLTNYVSVSDILLAFGLFKHVRHVVVVDQADRLLPRVWIFHGFAYECFFLLLSFLHLLNAQMRLEPRYPASLRHDIGGNH